MDQPTGREAYRACRDILVHHRDDYDAAVASFRWPPSATGSTGRSTGSTPSRPATRERRCASSGRTGAIAPTPSPSWPPAPIGSPRRWSPAASRPAIASWSC